MMDLFRTVIDEPDNFLPRDGVVKYFGILLPINEADTYFTSLLDDIRWKNDEVIIAGQHITTKRKVAWYGDSPFEYGYSNTAKKALPWTQDLLRLKTAVENKIGEGFNSCLLNLYHNGGEGMAWHSDAEKVLKKNGTIASVSLGAERRFCFKHKKTKETLSLVLEHGSLLLMSGMTQTFWQHRLPPTKLVNAPRINLTFRNIVTH